MGKFFQPSVNRSDVNSAPAPQLTGQATDVLKAFLQDPSSASRFFATSPLQQQTGNAYSQVLQALTGDPRQLNTANSQIADILSGGQGLIKSAQPIFDRNLESALRLNREFGGPSRFNSAVGRQATDLSQKALGDFNLFQQQVLENARGRQLQALMGALGGASQFALGQSAQQLPILQQLLGQSFGAGIGAPVITQGPSGFDIFGQLAGLGVGIASAGAGGGPTG